MVRHNLMAMEYEDVKDQFMHGPPGASACFWPRREDFCWNW